MNRNNRKPFIAVASLGAVPAGPAARLVVTARVLVVSRPSATTDTTAAPAVSS